MISGNASGEVWGMFGVVCGLLLFGTAYNAFVAWIEDRGYDEGFTAILVVGGVGVTLIGVAFVDWQAALTSFVAFCASGLPMVVGSLLRYAKRRERRQRDIAERPRIETLLDDVEIPDD